MYYQRAIDDDDVNAVDNDVLLMDTYMVCGEKHRSKDGIDVYDVAVHPAMMVTVDWDASGISFIKVTIVFIIDSCTDNNIVDGYDGYYQLH